MTPIALSLLIACGAPEPEDAPAWVSRSEEVMATRLDVTIPPHPDAGRSAGDAAADDVIAVFRDVEATANEWRDGAPLAQVNAAAGEAVTVPPDLIALLQRGLEVATLTDGAFDPTWAALWGLWDFRDPRVPSDDEIASRLAHVGWQGVIVDEEAGTVRLVDPEARLGLGGIAKGWALDRSVAALRARGVEDFLISAGGQVYAGGHKEGRPWRVGVRDPRGERDDFFALIEATDVSVSTSGDYERYFVHDGVRYHHVLDPRTGRPARGVRSATVVSADATLADALSTALVVMGVERGLTLVEQLPDVEAVLVDDRGDVHVSAGLTRRITIVHPPAR